MFNKKARQAGASWFTIEQAVERALEFNGTSLHDLEELLEDCGEISEEQRQLWEGIVAEAVLCKLEEEAEADFLKHNYSKSGLGVSSLTRISDTSSLRVIKTRHVLRYDIVLENGFFMGGYLSREQAVKEIANGLFSKGVILPIDDEAGSEIDRQISTRFKVTTRKEIVKGGQQEEEE